MGAEEHLQRLSNILESVDHSSPSNTKYQEAERLLAELAGLGPEQVYVTYISKAANISVRTEQSRRATNADLIVLLVERTDQDDAIRRAQNKVTGQRQKPTILLQRAAHSASWIPTYGVIPARNRSARILAYRLGEQIGPFEVDTLSPTGTQSPLSWARDQGSDPVPFTVLADGEQLSPHGIPQLLLAPTPQEDHGFRTTFELYYRDSSQTLHEIGLVKIGHAGLTRGRPPVPTNFGQLREEYFSLGQDDSYYEKLAGYGIREHVLTSLRDIALDDQVFAISISHEVTTKSLFRKVPRSTAEVQFRRIARGGARLTNYRFKYISPVRTAESGSALQLPFEVRAQSQPSTNMHVLIGSNGVGKTTLLKDMATTLTTIEDRAENSIGAFMDLDSRRQDANSQFANVVFVSFSAFDPFLSIAAIRDDEVAETLFSFDRAKVPASYIGLGSITPANSGPKGIAELANDFIESVDNCMSSTALRARWKRAIQALETDPIFRGLGILPLVDHDEDEPTERVPDVPVDTELTSLFLQASSGHKIVLLTMTRLVEEIRERSLVLFDEPESHLHPPLLAAFMRALSELLTDRNGVAIIATHSPVVLQEVPRECVWKLRRSGQLSTADRPQIETFGENVGVLTHEVFGLEVTQSGYHAELRRVAQEADAFEDAMAQFGGRLGAEAQGILRILLAVKPQAGTR
ncbi:AAA family ATPase [Nonomuraea sp. ZG12]|uniref:AAA family ATPase n=1 Tax=Nonomuraea sp. ZG12 TaxID=3452207 RepID=UPI003F889A8F